ncbi:MAG: BMC domain-containing protein [Synergistaceae bacterium]|nr:BMC domain-containing protein [Synergistaceae bacterium]
MGDAIYIVEYRSISRGVMTLDRMMKRSDVMALYAAPVCIGKYVIAVGGGVGDVRESKAEAEASDGIVAGYLITGAHPGVLGYFRRVRRERQTEQGSPDAVGIFETRNISSGFMSLDAALKNGQTQITRIWMGHFIGGKFCWVISGETSEVASSLAAAARAIPGDIVGSELIPRPDASTLYLFSSNSAAFDVTASRYPGGDAGETA